MLSAPQTMQSSGTIDQMFALRQGQRGMDDDFTGTP